VTATQSVVVTTPTQFVEVGDVSFAYRRFGTPERTPIVFINHFRGNLESFDPIISENLAADREVILFDNVGVGLSTGTAPDTIEAIAADAGRFIDALGLDLVDICAHSMGGSVGQALPLLRPELIRRVILVGCGPHGGEGMENMLPSTLELFTKTYERQDEMWLPIMFAPSEASQAAGWRWLERIRERQADRDVPVSEETQQAHLAAIHTWGAPRANPHSYQRDPKPPALEVNGLNDIVVTTVNSYILQQNLPNAELILYPDSNHGAHFQFPEQFSAAARQFLDPDKAFG
jgi:pimeloyl-ACP methyl ester carboxylesterase